jgi:hypothetical protein
MSTVVIAQRPRGEPNIRRQYLRRRVNATARDDHVCAELRGYVEKSEDSLSG